MATKKKKNVGGRPLKKFTAKDWKQLQEMCRIKCTRDEICHIMSVTDKTLVRIIKEKGYQSFSAYYDKYASDGKMSLRRTQFAKALDGSVPMLIWLGKQHLGQKERPEVEFELEDAQKENEKLKEKIEKILQVQGIVMIDG